VSSASKHIRLNILSFCANALVAASVLFAVHPMTKTEKDNLHVDFQKRSGII